MRRKKILLFISDRETEATFPQDSQDFNHKRLAQYHILSSLPSQILTPTYSWANACLFLRVQTYRHDGPVVRLGSSSHRLTAMDMIGLVS